MLHIYVRKRKDIPDIGLAELVCSTDDDADRHSLVVVGVSTSLRVDHLHDCLLDWFRELGVDSAVKFHDVFAR